MSNRTVLPGLLLAASLTACTTLQPVHPMPVGAATSLAAGDRLVITLTDGRTVEDRFVGATADALVIGTTVRGARRDDRTADHAAYTTISWSEIEKVERHAFSAGRTGALIAVTAVELAALASGMFVVP